MRLDVERVSCVVDGTENGGPIIFVGIFPGECADLFECVKERTDKPFVLCRFELNNWERDCAPWSCEIEGKSWKGGAEGTCSWLKNSAIPQMRKLFGEDRQYFIAGYSMAGLLALWTMYRTDAFEGAACCSGSLWYPEWDRFTEHNHIRSRESSVYLSIGGKESASGPEYMRCIGERMQDQLRQLKKDPNVRNSILEMNAGGHFTKTIQRLAKGIAWLIDHCE